MVWSCTIDIFFKRSYNSCTYGNIQCFLKVCRVSVRSHGVAPKFIKIDLNDRRTIIYL